MSRNWGNLQGTSLYVTGALRSAGRGLARATTIVANWTGCRVEDAATWAVNLIRDLPIRVARLAVTFWAGIWGLLTLIPAGIRVWKADGPAGFATWLKKGILRASAWLGTLVVRALDVLGVPELFGFVWRAVTHVTPLTGSEIAVLAEVLGPTALRYGDVRVAEGGILRAIFALNKGRAFTTFHTVNFPSSGAHTRKSLDVLVHELIHVYQHERIGSVYVGECIYAQMTRGYSYGGPSGLRQACTAGKHYCNYNREQQAKIVQDYYRLLCHAGDTADYEPFIAEMRAGKFGDSKLAR